MSQWIHLRTSMPRRSNYQSHYGVEGVRMNPLRSLEKLNEEIVENQLEQETSLKEMERLSALILTERQRIIVLQESLSSVTKLDQESVHTTALTLAKTLFNEPSIIEQFTNKICLASREFAAQETVSLRFKVTYCQTTITESEQSLDDLRQSVRNLQQALRSLQRRRPSLVEDCKISREKLMERVSYFEKATPEEARLDAVEQYVVASTTNTTPPAQG